MRQSTDNQQTSLFEITPKAIYSSKHFIIIQKMTEEEHKKLTIYFQYTESPYGRILIASTESGICFMAFEDNEEEALHQLKTRFPKAKIQRKETESQQNALQIFQPNTNEILKICLHVKGSDFQLKVWNELLKIQQGKLTTYGNIAKQIGQPKASRAVGTAVGCNPIAYLIPCHRVVQAAGRMGGYRWGVNRKKAMIANEKAMGIDP